MVDIPASFCNAVDLQYCLSGVAASFYAVFCAVDGREGVLKVRRISDKTGFDCIAFCYTKNGRIADMGLLPVSMQWMSEKEY